MRGQNIVRPCRRLRGGTVCLNDRDPGPRGAAAGRVEGGALVPAAHTRLHLEAAGAGPVVVKGYARPRLYVVAVLEAFLFCVSVRRKSPLRKSKNLIKSAS